MFGGVFRAWQLAYGTELREVAVKVSRRAMSDLEARHAFADALRMVRVAEAATNPAIRQHFVTVYDAGRVPEGQTLGGHPYVVMELIRGGSVQRYLKAGPFPFTRADMYFVQ